MSSIHRFFNDQKSQGIPISKDALREYYPKQDPEPQLGAGSRRWAAHRTAPL